jgi:hypothetical protein
LLLPRSISALETLMGNETIDSTIISQAQEAMDFMANVLEASTEYSIIGKDLEGITPPPGSDAKRQAWSKKNLCVQRR